MKHLFKNNDGQAWQWVSFALIAAVVWVVYAPSLMHVARADQLMYLAEIGHKQSLWDLTFGSIDLNRHRLYSPGDEVLFRPLDYILLGIEKYFFGNVFIYWQAVGIFLHLLVIWLLLKLLLTIHRGWPAVMATCFFAVLMVNMEMVIWHHINAYMIFVAVTLSLLRRLMDYLSGKAINERDSLIIFLLTLTGCFTHEVGNIVALSLGVISFIFLKQHKHLYRAFFLSVLIYVLASLTNAILHPFDTTMYQHNKFWQVIKDVAYALYCWFYAGFFPYEIPWALFSRNMMSQTVESLFHGFGKFHVASWVAIVSMLALAGCLVRYYRRDEVKAPWIVGIICIIVIMGYTAIIALGRGSQWGIWDVVRVNTYYMYIFWVFLIIAFYACIDWTKVSKLLQWVICVSLMILCMFNANKLYALNEQQVSENNKIAVLVQTLELLIKEHGHEKDFSFYVDPKYPGNFIYEGLRRINEPDTVKYSFAKILYPKYFEEKTPKYKLLVK